MRFLLKSHQNLHFVPFAKNSYFIQQMTSEENKLHLQIYEKICNLPLKFQLKPGKVCIWPYEKKELSIYNEDCPKYIIKYINLDSPELTHYNNEVSKLTLLKETEIACQLIDFWECVVESNEEGEGKVNYGFILLEKVEGVSLKDFLQANPNNLKKCNWKVLIDQIEAMFKLGVCHGDLSLDNILVQKDGAAFKFIDFGTEIDKKDVRYLCKEIKQALGSFPSDLLNYLLQQLSQVFSVP